MIPKTDSNNNGVAVLPAGYQEFCNIWTECESRNYITGALMHRPDCPQQAKKAGFKAKHKQTKVSWATKYGQLTQEIIDSDFLDPDVIIGKRFGKETNYFLIDIDITSDLHPDNNPGALEEYLEIYQEIGITEFVRTQSSDSSGLHTFGVLPSNQPSWAIAKLTDKLSRKHGYDPTDGQLELIPNADSREKGRAVKPDGKKKMFQGHRLPGQHGWALLNSFCEPEHDQSLSAFVRQWENAKVCQDEDLFRESIEEFIRANSWDKTKAKKSGEPRPKRFALQHLIDRGWTGEGQSNEMFGAIAAYCVEVMGCKTVTQVVVEGMNMAINMPGYDSFCGHQHELEQRIRDWAKGALNRWSVHDSSVEYTPVKNLNQERAESAQHRIRLGVAKLQGQAFTTARSLLKALKDLTGAAIKTLYKYRDSWIHLLTDNTESRQPSVNSHVETRLSQPEKNPNFSGGVERAEDQSQSAVLHLEKQYKGVNPPCTPVEDSSPHTCPPEPRENQNLPESSVEISESQCGVNAETSRDRGSSSNSIPNPKNLKLHCHEQNQLDKWARLNPTKSQRWPNVEPNTRPTKPDRVAADADSVHASRILRPGSPDEPRAGDRDGLFVARRVAVRAQHLPDDAPVSMGFGQVPVPTDFSEGFSVSSNANQQPRELAVNGDAEFQNRRECDRGTGCDRPCQRRPE